MSSSIVLQDAIKTYTYDQDKIISPAKTVKWVKDKFKEINLDILKKTMRIDSGRLGIPIFISLCGTDALKTIGTKKQMGKGATPAQSEASALIELVERYSFFYLIKFGNFHVDTYQNVKDKAISFKSIALSVHDESDLKIAEQAFSDIPLSWVPAYSLTENRETLIPIDWFYAINEFNGPAAGNTIEEAIIQGICEVVERHVSALISHKKLLTPSIDVRSVKNPVALELMGKYLRTGVKLFIKDFSLDMGIPSVGVLVQDPKTFPHRSEIVFTAGTQTSPEKALIRSLTEVAQLAGDFDTDAKYVPSGLPKPSDLDEMYYVTTTDKIVNISDLPDISHYNIKNEIERCVGALSKMGLDVLVINTTHPVLQIPAVYIVIPGTHFRQRARAASICLFSAKLVSQFEDVTQAIMALDRLRALYPDRYYIYFYLGLCHLRKEKYERALKFFKKALELNPGEEDIPSIYCYMGICHKDMEDYEQAIAELEKAKAHDAQIKEIYNLLGFCYFKLKDHEKSIENFTKVVDMDPASAIDYANIASNLREMGNIKEAIRFYQLALEIDPGIDFARDNLERLQSLTFCSV